MEQMICNLACLFLLALLITGLFGMAVTGVSKHPRTQEKITAVNQQALNQMQAASTEYVQTVEQYLRKREQETKVTEDGHD